MASSNERNRPLRHFRATSNLSLLLLLSGGGHHARFVSSAATTSRGSTKKRCQTLHTSMTYSQDKAPRDISATLPQIVQKVNEALEGVVDVEVNWEGGEPMHRRVGEHRVEMDVTRLLSALKGGRDQHRVVYDEDDVGKDSQGRDVVTQCFTFPFQILDTDECTLPSGHPMRHQCASPAFCVNTIGSYECVCPARVATSSLSLEGGIADDAYFETLASQKRGPWELSLNLPSMSSCPGQASTRSCCSIATGGGSGDDCRAAFRCPIDPCSTGGTNECASSARCVRSNSPIEVPGYECRCPAGMMGSGGKCKKSDVKPRPMVEYDGVTPTTETVRNNFYCGCTKPVVDACAGFPKCEEKHKICTVVDGNRPTCACKPGYVDIQPWGCVDETPPILKLRHDPNNNGINRLKQGDLYEEYAVDIDDDNAEQYQRQLKITYSRPLPPGCLANIGQFHVNYTVATPWTNPPYARVTRTVVVENIDECSINVEKYKTQCPQLIPQCDVAAGAVCTDTIGSYTCKCPKHTSGDGFLPIANLERDGRGRYIDGPEGYSGGSSCRDTSKPVLEILGPNPKVFRVCKCGGLRGIIGKRNKGEEEEDFEQLRGDQRGRYETDIKEMIKETAGAELCATHARPNPSPSDCVRASDHTFRGVTDLSDRVVVGEPVKKGDVWMVPYDVSDHAGNKARTVYRTVRVEEVDLNDVEGRIRDEILADKQSEIDRAVTIALEKERRRRPREDSTGSKSCPPCLECNCPDRRENGLSEAQCLKICDERIKTEYTCQVNDYEAQSLPKDTLHPVLQEIFSFFEGIFSAGVLLTILLCTFAMAVLIIVQRILIAIFNPGTSSYYTRADEEKERAMLRAVTYYRSPGAATSPSNGVASSVPPRATLSGAAVGNGIFSPPENRMHRQREVFSSSGSAGDGGIYATMSPITPARSNGTPASFDRRRY